MYDPNWAKVDSQRRAASGAPPPGPKSQEIHARAAAKYMKGYSSQVRLFPVAFESGKGCTLTDVDGNTYIDFSSGIYVTGLGHCHPKVTEAVQKAAGELMNAHDFTTPIKMRLLEKLAEIAHGRGQEEAQRHAALRFRHHRRGGRPARDARGDRQVRVHLLPPRFPRQDDGRGRPGAAGCEPGAARAGLLPGAARLLLSLRVPADTTPSATCCAWTTSAR